MAGGVQRGGWVSLPPPPPRGCRVFRGRRKIFGAFGFFEFFAWVGGLETPNQNFGSIF